MSATMSPYTNNLLTQPAINIETEHREILKHLQANILRHHKRKHSCYIFLRFIDEQELNERMIESEKEEYRETAQQVARVFMNKLAHGIQDNKVTIRLTSTLEQMGLDEAAQGMSKQSLAAREITTMALSHTGYDFLELGYMSPKSVAFKEGTKKIQAGFHTDMDSMESHFADTHAMVMIASNKKEDLKNCIKLLEAEIKTTPIKILHRQYGQLIIEEIGGKKKRNVYKDHFGYVDGISQPIFFPKGKGAALKAKDIASLDAVLIPDKGSGNPKLNYGSYQVVLKLQQNEDAFNQLVKELVASPPQDQDGNPVIVDEDDAKAYIMGRYPKGASILNKSKKNEYHFDHDFDYDELFFDGKKWQKDKYGMACPLFAHVRKMNAGDKKPYGYQNRKMARRGVPYADGEKEKGILFLSFQSSIEHQLEDLIINKLHNPIYNGVMGGVDILTGKAEKVRIMKGKNRRPLKVPAPLTTYLGRWAQAGGDDPHQNL
ncbi:MAG: hypothetical protein AAF573_20885, partial [Bacteroidota bacterium]